MIKMKERFHMYINDEYNLYIQNEKIKELTEVLITTAKLMNYKIRYNIWKSKEKDVNIYDVIFLNFINNKNLLELKYCRDNKLNLLNIFIYAEDKEDIYNSPKIINEGKDKNFIWSLQKVISML